MAGYFSVACIFCFTTTSCAAAKTTTTTTIYEVIEAAATSWTTAWASVVSSVEDDTVELLLKPEVSPTLLTWENFEEFAPHSEGKIIVDSLDELGQFAQENPGAWSNITMKSEFYAPFNVDNGTTFPSLNIVSKLFLVELDETGTRVHELFSNRIRAESSSIEDCQSGDFVVTSQVACQTVSKSLCDPMLGIWERRSDLQASYSNALKRRIVIVFLKNM